MLVLLVVGGVGYGYWKRGQIRMQRASEAIELDLRVDKLLKSARPADFTEAESALSIAFDRAPAQPLTALSWLRERITRALWIDPATPGIETAITRAEQSGVADGDLSFARAGVLVARGRAKEALESMDRSGTTRDAPMHFVAGLALERMGDPRAGQELEAAARAEKDFVPARVLAAVHLALEAIPRAKEAIESLRADFGDRPDVTAAAALAWAVGPRESPISQDAQNLRAHAADLPIPLRFVPDLLDGIDASARRPLAPARAALAKAAAAATAPAFLAVVGRAALGARDESLARDIAARTATATDRQSRTLAALVALLEGRLDDAVDAASKLDGASADANGIRALAAYERLDPIGFANASSSLPWGSVTLDVLRGSELSPARIRSLDAPSVPLGGCLAVDAALDAGNLVLARELMEAWGDKPGPAHAARIARLQRYADRTADAETTFAGLGAAKPTARSALERVLLLVQAGKPHDAKSVVASNAPAFGEAAPWAHAYADAAGGRADEAKRALGKLPPPAESAPLELRVLATLAYASAGDKKDAEPLLKKLASKVPHHPDLAKAAAMLGGGRGKRAR